MHISIGFWLRFLWAYFQKWMIFVQFLAFWGKSMLFFIMVILILHQQGSCFPTSLGYLLLIVFNNSHHNQSEMESQWSFDLHFLQGQKYLKFFIYLLAICSSFEKSSIFEKVIHSDHLANFIGLLILLMVFFFLILYVFWILIMSDG
jgi:hypothetical protein